MIFALAMSLFLFGMIAMVIDVSYEYTWSTRAQGAAQIGAQAGANDVDPNFLYGLTKHVINLNSTVTPTKEGACPDNPPGCIPDYQLACVDAADTALGLPLAKASDSNFNQPPPVGQPQTFVHCSVNGPGTCVTAHIQKDVIFPLGFFGLSSYVRTQFIAAPVIGANTPTADNGLLITAC